METSQERLNLWTDGKVNASERRILLTKWAGDAWDVLASMTIIKVFKHCGVANDINGNENHRVRVQNLRTYKPPTKDQREPMKRLTEEEIEQWKQAEISMIKERMG